MILILFHCYFQCYHYWHDQCHRQCHHHWHVQGAKRCLTIAASPSGFLRDNDGDGRIDGLRTTWQCWILIKNDFNYFEKSRKIVGDFKDVGSTWLACLRSLFRVSQVREVLLLLTGTTTCWDNWIQTNTFEDQKSQERELLWLLIVRNSCLVR